jgi:N-acetylmuramoyl-L-alanine amidase
MRILSSPSPNFGLRRGCDRPNLILLHYTAMATAEAALERLRDPAVEVSAHYLIGEDGCTWQLVPDEARAWHAGVGAWMGQGDVNSRSIGIELANPGPLAGFPPFAEPQMTALETLLDDLMARWGIAPDRVLGHSDTAPGRKFDPGPKFDWRRLALGGRAVWAATRRTGPAHPEGFARAAASAGYGIEVAGWEQVLHALRLRLRPWAIASPLDAADVALAETLASIGQGAPLTGG